MPGQDLFGETVPDPAPRREALPFRSRAELKAAGAILGFQGEHRWLSNFWPVPVTAYGIVFPCNEQAYVAAKLHPGSDPASRELARLLMRFVAGLEDLDRRRWLSFTPGAAPESQAQHRWLGELVSPLGPGQVLRVRTPAEAKRLGRDLPLRPDWDEVRISLMATLQTRKYAAPEMAERLLATGDVPIVELNAWGDTFWGAVERKGQIVGHNRLGLILEARRAALVAEPGTACPSP